MKNLLILHGALGTADLMNPLKSALQDDFKVHSLSFSGHGDAPFNENGFGIEAFAKEVKAYLQTNNLENIPVFGYSMGGYVALHLESVHPNRFSQITTLGTKFDWNPESARHESSRLVPAVISEKVPRFAALLDSRHQDWERLVESTAQMMRSLGDAPLLTTENMGEIKCPITIMLGDADNMVSHDESEKAAQNLPNGQFKLLENCPHPIEKVNAEMLANVLKSLI